jgi:dCTP deaminase
MSNFGHLDLQIAPGTAVCQFVFQRTEGTGAYEGIFQEQTPKTFWQD